MQTTTTEEIKMEISFIQPGRNNLKYLKWSYDSIRKNQGNYIVEICVADDASTDGTYDLVTSYIKSNGYDNKCTVIRKDNNTKQAHSRYIAYNMCDPNEICCMLDGDDALCDDDMLLYKINDEYKKHNLLVGYGQFFYMENINKIGRLSGHQEYTKDEINNNSYRDKWVTQHLRTCEARLLQTIPENYLKYKGEWLKCCTDLAEMWWVLEKSGGRHKNMKFPCYYYNKQASLNIGYSYYNQTNEDERKYRADVTNYLSKYKTIVD